jgi:GDP-L-fucose synthase
MSIDSSSRIYVAGHKGMVGSATVRALRRNGYQNLVLSAHRELDLTSQSCADAD